jgi:hypothetical protein
MDEAPLMPLLKPELPSRGNRRVQHDLPRSYQTVADKLRLSKTVPRSIFIASTFKTNEKGKVMEYFLKPVLNAQISWGPDGHHDETDFEKRFKVFPSYTSAEDFLMSIQMGYRNNETSDIGHIYQVVQFQNALWAYFYEGFRLDKNGLRITRSYFNNFDNAWEELNPIDISKFLSIGN